MSPKFMDDEDGDIPPCSIMESIKAVEKWEKYKNERHGDRRKAPCSCRHFIGKVPDTHICTKIKKQHSGCFGWFIKLFKN